MTSKPNPKTSGWRAKLAAVGGALVGIVIVAYVEQLASRMEMYQSHVPGGYFYFQQRLQALNEPAKICPVQLLDTSGVEVVSSPESARQFLAQVKMIVAAQPSALIIDIDLARDTAAGTSYTSVERDLLEGLNRTAAANPQTQILIATPFGKARGKVPPYESLWVGAAQFPDLAIHYGVHWWYPTRQTVKDRTLGEFEIVHLASLLKKREKPSGLALLESEQHESEGSSDYVTHWTMRLLNYGAVPALVAQHKPLYQSALADLKGRTVVLGDLSDPGEGDKAAIPGYGKRAGVLLLSSAVFTQSYAPVAKVAHQYELLFSIAVSLLLFGLRALAESPLVCLLETAKVPAGLAKKLGYWLVQAGSIGMSLILFAHIFPQMGLLVEGFMANLTIQLLELVFHSLKHDLAHNEQVHA